MQNLKLMRSSRRGLKLIDFDTLKIEHRINRRMKHSYIAIEHERVILKSPPISERYARQILEDKRQWIHRKLAEQTMRQPLQCRMGSEVFYLGEKQSLEANAEFDDLIASIAAIRKLSDTSLQRCYDSFYKRRAYDHLAERLDSYEKMMELSAGMMQIRKMKRRWGSCSSSGVITFNSHLIQLPEALIDYVVVHELAHLKEMNHSKAFYAVVESVLPDYKHRQKAMKKFILDF